ncbi:hypothetical protein [Burkholderia plantarii]|uniref:hypothetical protein n=1 Tax=Burkholderia plantarii TaxID=41899 RepID=UPI001F5BBBFF|nr:hypothetical protein [Burkholderia plantarii]
MRYAVEPVIVASDPVLLLDAARAGQGMLLAMDASMAPEVEGAPAPRAAGLGRAAAGSQRAVSARTRGLAETAGVPE